MVKGILQNTGNRNKHGIPRWFKSVKNGTQHMYVKLFPKLTYVAEMRTADRNISKKYKNFVFHLFRMSHFKFTE